MTSHDSFADPVIRQLEQLGTTLEFPPTPPIAEAVSAAIHSEPKRRWWLPYSLVATALVIALISAPQVRSAIWVWLEVVGIELRTSESPRKGDELPLLDESLFGVPSTLAEAEDAFGKPLALPTDTLSSSPDDIYLKTDGNGIVAVTFVYAASESLPAIGESDIGAILTQFTGSSGSPYLLKFMMEFDHPVYVSEDNVQMQWIERGELTSASEPDAWRSSANVLIWGDGNSGYRLESGLSQKESESIAESMAPE